MIINGRLVKNITFKTIREKDGSHCDEKFNRVCGDVQYCNVEIPFHLFIEVPGAEPGDNCEVIDAIVAGEFDKLIDKNSDGTFNRLLEKAVIKIRAKVTRTKHLKVHAIDITPPPLSCRTVSDVFEVEGLDVAQETVKIDP